MARKAEEIEKAVLELPAAELRKFRAWYEKFDSEIWDQQIEADIEMGRLDELAEKAIDAHLSGKSTKL